MSKIKKHQNYQKLNNQGSNEEIGNSAIFEKEEAAESETQTHASGGTHPHNDRKSRGHR